MVLLVFGNVVLRYGFNSGITVSEEVSRWLFIWGTFMGAIVALREHGRLQATQAVHGADLGAEDHRAVGFGDEVVATGLEARHLT